MTTDSAYAVRRASKADLDRLVELISDLQDHIEAANPDLWTQSLDSRRHLKNTLTARLQAAGSCALVADHAQAGVVGAIFGRVLSNKRYTPSRSGSVDQLFVLPEHRRRGIGSQLVAELCEFFAGEGVDALSLRYVLGNDQAAGFWQALGFEPRIVAAGASRQAVQACIQPSPES